MATARSTYPLFPTDDGWPYPDLTAEERDVEIEEADVDLDALELQADPHLFDGLSAAERELVERRFGLRGAPTSMKVLARARGCSRAEVREQLGGAIEKMRARLAPTDG